jgi:hypothetical protein
MAYEFDLGDIEGPYTDSEGSQIVEFVLGVDSDADTVVVMCVILFPTERPDTLELCFGIRTKTVVASDGSVDVSKPDYRNEGAKKYIPDHYRSEVLAKVKDCVSRIVGVKMPDFIAMETFYPYLPPQALAKYTTIGASIIAQGFILADSFRQESSGINYWLFKKRD